jgi:hypothetical protein
VTASEFAHFLAQIASILDSADEQLTGAERARLRVATEYRHEDWLGIAQRAQLADAETELSPEEVRRLEARIADRLLELPPPGPCV